MAFKPSDKRKFTPAEEDLDITPIMNLVVVLIPLLLASAEFVKLGLLEMQLPPTPAAGVASMPEQEEEPKGKLNLIVSVDSLGFAVSVFGATPESETAAEHYHRIPMDVQGEYDFDALNERCWQIRSEIVVPSILGKVQNQDEEGNLLFNVDGTPQMVDDYSFIDAERVIISAPNEFPFGKLVKVMDATRVHQTGPGAPVDIMFPTPMMGKIQ